MKVIVRDNQIEKAIKDLKRKLTKEGFFSEIKERRFYDKPSVQKKKKQAKAAKRRRKRLRSLRRPRKRAGRNPRKKRRRRTPDRWSCVSFAKAHHRILGRLSTPLEPNDPLFPRGLHLHDSIFAPATLTRAYFLALFRALAFFLVFTLALVFSQPLPPRRSILGGSSEPDTYFWMTCSRSTGW